MLRPSSQDPLPQYEAVTLNRSSQSSDEGEEDARFSGEGEEEALFLDEGEEDARFLDEVKEDACFSDGVIEDVGFSDGVEEDVRFSDGVEEDVRHFSTLHFSTFLSPFAAIYSLEGDDNDSNLDNVASESSGEITRPTNGVENEKPKKRLEWARPHLFGDDDDGISITPAKILAAKFVLRRIFPMELIRNIVIYSDMFVPLTTSRQGVVRVGGSSEQSSTIYLWSDKVRGGEMFPVRRIRWKAQSRDQGWSSYPKDQKTRSGSWTWFTVVKESSTTESSISGSSTSEQERAKEFDLFTNIHAGSKWESWEVIWEMDHELVRSLKKGDRVGLVLKAQYPGWVNNVRKAEITLECAW